VKLIGYLLLITYSDGSQTRHRYRTDELSLLDTKINDLMTTDLAGINGFSVIKEWDS